MAKREGDMLVNLMQLPQNQVQEGIRIKRAFPGDKDKIMEFIKANFSQGWCGETEQALFQSPSKCFIATENGRLLGFACYDASAKDFFGPIGVAESERGKNIGTALLLRTLEAMRADGYVYAVIGWVDDAADFYRKTVGAKYIEGGDPKHSVYSNLIFMK